MSDMIKSDYALTQTAASYAHDIFDTIKDENGGDAFDAEAFRDEMNEKAWEYADGSEHVIYTARAIAICGNCNTNTGEERAEDIYGKPFDGCETFAEVCTRLAFFTLLCEIESELSDLIDAWEPAEEFEGEVE